jgi:DNA-binding MarR family transcriptional regulator
MPRLDRNARARLMVHAEALDRRTRLPGQHGGCLKRTGLAVLRALLCQFANVVTGRCDPSFDALARVAGVARATVAVALRRLEAAGILDRIRRQRGTRRWTNAYIFPWSRFRPQTTTKQKTTNYGQPFREEEVLGFTPELQRALARLVTTALDRRDAARPEPAA